MPRGARPCTALRACSSSASASSTASRSVTTGAGACSPTTPSPTRGSEAMPAIKSQLDPRSPEFRANAARMRGLVEDLKQKAAAVSLGGDEAARKKHTARGKLLVRERVRALLDPG